MRCDGVDVCDQDEEDEEDFEVEVEVDGGTCDLGEHGGMVVFLEMGGVGG